MKLEQTGVGTESHTRALRDSAGIGVIPIQAENSDAAGTTFRVLGRVSPDAPWVEIIPAANDNFLESISYVPYLQLEVTAGAGSVSLWVHDA